MNLYQHPKNQLIPSIHFEIHSYVVQRLDWPYPFFTMPVQNFFDQLLIFANLHQHAKNESFSLICSGEIVDLKILESDWLRASWSISQEQDFSQI